MKDLLVMCPTRGRRAQCERFLESFEDTTDDADLIFILDPDDDSYEGMDWGGEMAALCSPRNTLSGKLNITAAQYADAYRALMFAGDDHVFRTEGWDSLLIHALDRMGGTGMVYPDDRRRNDIPEIIMISSDIVKALGHFAEPTLAHYHIDNVWSEIGRKASLLRFCPDAVVEHLHYSMDPSVEHDRTYREAENEHGPRDFGAYNAWRATLMPSQVSILRRNFNKDVKWVLDCVT